MDRELPGFFFRNGFRKEFIQSQVEPWTEFVLRDVGGESYEWHLKFQSYQLVLEWENYQIIYYGFGKLSMTLLKMQGR